MCDSKMDGDKCREWKDCGFDWDKSEDKWDVVLMKPGNYQEFKFDVIAKLPVENWEITEEQISDWLATKLTEPK